MGAAVTLDETFLPHGVTPRAQRADVVRVGAFQERSRVAGPGERVVVWVTGCLRRCPECIKPDFLSFDVGEDTVVETLAARILAVPNIDGVTFSGGEPFEQAAALGSVAAIVRNRHLSVVCYSGYRIEALRQEPARFGPLLDQTDLLIDGEYRREYPGPLPWRGSANQNLHVLTVRGQLPENPNELVREMQLSLSPEGLRITGFPSRSVEKELSEELAKRGISLEKKK